MGLSLSFVSAVQPVDALKGTVAALSDGIFVADNLVLNDSLGISQMLETSSGASSGFAMVDGLGMRTTAPNSASPGIAQRVDFDLGAMVRPTRMIEAPVIPAETTDTNKANTTTSVFTRSLAPLADHSAIVSLSTSGFMVLPWQYDASVANPVIKSIASAADQSPAVASGGLFTIRGTNLSSTTVASSAVPAPTALGDACLTVSGELVPLIYVSPNQINGQIPFEAMGESTLVVRTPNGVSNEFQFDVQDHAPTVFQTALAQTSNTLIPTIVRAKNNLRVTSSNPIHLDDRITIYATGLGGVDPQVATGAGGPSDPLATAMVEPEVTLGGTKLPVAFAGLAAGQVGVYQINAVVPFKGVPTGMSVPLKITQGTYSTTLKVRVVK